MHIFANRVEIRVGNEVRGGWAIFSPDDLKEAQKMAREFQCNVTWEEENPFRVTENLTNATTN